MIADRSAKTSQILFTTAFLLHVTVPYCQEMQGIFREIVFRQNNILYVEQQTLGGREKTAFKIK